MRITSRKASLLYKGILVVVAFLGIYLNLGLPKKPSLNLMLYYTIQSNLLCLGYFIYLLYLEVKQKQVIPRVKGAVTLAISVTLLIYWIVLAPMGFDMNDGRLLDNLLVHLITPLMVIGDYLLFDKKRELYIQRPSGVDCNPFGIFCIHTAYICHGDNLY